MIMFVPRLYRPEDSGWIDEIIGAHPLALLITSGSDYPAATHCPVIADPDGQRPLAPGGRLLGHLNRQNPMWEAIRHGGHGLVIFQGPGSYVSPVHYEDGPAAPTWNFVAVHVQGMISPIRESAETLVVIEATVDQLEADHGAGWDRSGSADYFGELLPGVGAFRFTIHRLDAMFKLSQEKRPAIRERVSQAFAATGPLPLAQWMDRVGTGGGA
jgi:transcriptional regulator